MKGSFCALVKNYVFRIFEIFNMQSVGKGLASETATTDKYGSSLLVEHQEHTIQCAVSEVQCTVDM